MSAKSRHAEILSLSEMVDESGESSGQDVCLDDIIQDLPPHLRSFARSYYACGHRADHALPTNTSMMEIYGVMDLVDEFQERRS